MKICASTYSFGKYRENGIEFMIDKAAKLGFDGVEIVDGTFDGSDDPATAETVRALCAKQGLEIASFCTGAELLYGDEKEHVRRLCAKIDAAAAYGAAVFRHDVSGGFRGEDAGKTYDDAIPIVAPICREAAAYAQSVGVVSTTENHGYFSQDSARVKKLIEKTAHANFGALIDLGNFMCVDEDPNAAVAALAPYAKHVHAKDFYFKPRNGEDPGPGWFGTRGGNHLKGAIIGQGDARVFRSLAILKNAGYDGWISVEFEGTEDNLTGLLAGRENLEKFWRSV